jgi:sialate O-acetylesterase
MLRFTQSIVCFISIIAAQYCVAQSATPWNKKQCAVVLTYDDAIDVDLDNAIPVLDSLKLKATFYLIGSSPVVTKRMNEWRLVAKHGHELGNHTLFHPCDGSRPGRTFVTPESDLSRYTMQRAVQETRATNTLLKAIDGKDKRTLAYPCGDLTVEGKSFYDQIKPDFVAARGVSAGLESFNQINFGNVKCYTINGQSAEYMIGLVKQAMAEHKLIVFLFHGVGGGHNINVDLKEHSKLLHYLKDNEKNIWIAPMVDVAQYVQNNTNK